MRPQHLIPPRHRVHQFRHSTTVAPSSPKTTLLHHGLLAPQRTQRDIAALIGMTPDAFSRSVNGTRSFSSVELAKIAELLRVDVYWLITGNDDPNRLMLFARHTFDRDTREHLVSGH